MWKIVWNWKQNALHNYVNRNKKFDFETSADSFCGVVLRMCISNARLHVFINDLQACCVRTNVSEYTIICHWTAYTHTHKRIQSKAHISMASFNAISGVNFEFLQASHCSTNKMTMRCRCLFHIHSTPHKCLESTYVQT